MDTTGKVTGKEHIRFDEANPWYLADEGTRIDVRMGDEQWRIYYEIDNFAGLDEPLRGRLSRAEKERAGSRKNRYWIASKEWCESTDEGDR